MSRKINVGLALAVLISVGAQALAAAAPKLPYGPEGKGRFGAYYTKLNYTPEWDAQWRVGDKADVVVRFDQYDYRVVFWRGTNYVPFWVNENRVWNEIGCVERADGSPKWDKLCKYSFVSIIESTDARVIVRWRYALVDKDYKLINTDPMTNWNDWVDEYYTIYPDTTTVRTMKLYSSDLSAPISCKQGLAIFSSSDISPNAEGASPVEIIEGDIVPTIIPNEPQDWPPLGLVEPGEKRALPLSTTWRPYTQSKISKSWRMMTYMAKAKGASSYISLAWISPPALIVSKGNSKSFGYSKEEKAYQLASLNPGAPSTLNLKLSGPNVYNPAFVIKGWGKKDISLSIDGKPIQRGPDFRYGFRKTDTVSDLIIWVKKQSTKPVSIEIKPLQGGK